MDFNIEQCEPELRRVVEQRVGAFGSDGSWDHWFEEIRDETFFTLEQAAEALADKIRGARRNMPRQPGPQRRGAYSFGMAPGWWPDHVRVQLEKWRQVQAQVLAAFGLDAPMTLREADAMLVCALGSQERVGRKAVVEFTHYYNEPGFSTPYDDAEQIETIERDVAYSGNSYGWTGNGRAEKPLYVLATYSGMLEWQMGCRPFQAVDFLLCGEQFVPPWVGVDMREGSGVIELRVGSPSVPAAEVTKAYTAAVSALRVSQHDVAEAAPKRRRSRRARTLALLAFVDGERPAAKTLEDWRQLRATWNEANPDWAFPSPEAMRERYRRISKSGTARGQGS